MHHDECCVCLDERVGTRLEPCLHEVLCAPCARLVLAARGECPLCRQRISTLCTNAAFGRHGSYNPPNRAPAAHPARAAAVPVLVAPDAPGHALLRQHRGWDPADATTAPPPYFHGALSATRAQARLTAPGDFLVRETGLFRTNYVLSVLTTAGKTVHATLGTAGQPLVRGATVYATVGDLLVAWGEGRDAPPAPLGRAVPLLRKTAVRV